MSDPDQYYLHVSSKDSEKFYPKNTGKDFRVNLVNPLHLEKEWECALLATTLAGKWNGGVKGLALCCNICSETNYYGTMKQVLRELQARDFKGGRVIYQKPLYVDIITPEIKTLELCLKGSGEEATDPRVTALYLTLHLRRKKKQR